MQIKNLDRGPVKTSWVSFFEGNLWYQTHIATQGQSNGHWPFFQSIQLDVNISMQFSASEQVSKLASKWLEMNDQVHDQS